MCPSDGRTSTSFATGQDPRPDAADERPVVGELVDPLDVVVRHPDVVRGGVVEQRRRPAQLAGGGSLDPPALDERAIRPELRDAVVLQLRHQDVAVAVDCQATGPGERELARTRAQAAEREERVQVRVEDSDGLVAVVGDVQPLPDRVELHPGRIDRRVRRSTQRPHERHRRRRDRRQSCRHCDGRRRERRRGHGSGEHPCPPPCAVPMADPVHDNPPLRPAEIEPVARPRTPRWSAADAPDRSLRNGSKLARPGESIPKQPLNAKFFVIARIILLLRTELGGGLRSAGGDQRPRADSRRRVLGRRRPCGVRHRRPNRSAARQQPRPGVLPTCPRRVARRPPRGRRPGQRPDRGHVRAGWAVAQRGPVRGRPVGRRRLAGRPDRPRRAGRPGGRGHGRPDAGHPAPGPRPRVQHGRQLGALVRQPRHLRHPPAAGLRRLVPPGLGGLPRLQPAVRRGAGRRAGAGRPGAGRGLPPDAGPRTCSASYGRTCGSATSPTRRGPRRRRSGCCPTTSEPSS